MGGISSPTWDDITFFILMLQPAISAIHLQQQNRADKSTPKILVNPTEEHDLMSQPVELLSLAAMAHYSRTRCIKEMARSRTSHIMTVTRKENLTLGSCCFFRRSFIETDQFKVGFKERSTALICPLEIESVNQLGHSTSPEQSCTRRQSRELSCER